MIVGKGTFSCSVDLSQGRHQQSLFTSAAMAGAGRPCSNIYSPPILRSWPAARSNAISGFYSAEDLHLRRTCAALSGVGRIPAQVGQARGPRPHPTQLTSSRSYLPPVCGHGRFVEDGVGLDTHAVPLIEETRQGFFSSSISCATLERSLGPRYGQSGIKTGPVAADRSALARTGRSGLLFSR